MFISLFPSFDPDQALGLTPDLFIYLFILVSFLKIKFIYFN